MLEHLLHETIKKYMDPSADILSIESKPIHIGLQAVALHRHSIHLKNRESMPISLVTKYATRLERRVLNRLYLQQANVPFMLTNGSEEEERALVCIQDVDYTSDYSNLNIEALQQKEIKALSHIHTSNFGHENDLTWLPRVDRDHIEAMINIRWKPQWQAAIKNEQFLDIFGDYIPSVEAAAATIFQDIVDVMIDENSYTLIHNDLNPGNVLVHNNSDVFFIDWEDARYGSLFFDIPLRCSTPEQIESYRVLLAARGLEFSDHRFYHLYTTAARYLGLRYMSWNLGTWASDSKAKEDLRKYLNMVVGNVY
ncbi:phosphotransferase [Paenibacillus sp. GCM10028914]|uniref:phosphotransferase n=1 Tax=Paenibacillus sp. GCM10028914 TaxID=3273416 RepID=UPI0036191777